MIDEEDGDFFLLASMGAGPFLAAILLVLAIVCYVAATQNEEDCKASECPPGQTAQLLDHQCVCTSAPIGKQP